jgi:hypothetical protein
MSTFPTDRGWRICFARLLNVLGLDFLRMLAAPRLSAARSGGAKASLHLDENEILDHKVNCSEDYGDNNSAP